MLQDRLASRALMPSRLVDEDSLRLLIFSQDFIKQRSLFRGSRANAISLPCRLIYLLHTSFTAYLCFMT